MSFKSSVFIAAIAMLPAMAAAQASPVRESCAGDIKALCGSTQPGGGRIRDCMKQHRAELSSPCKLAIADRMLERHGNPSAAVAAPATAAAAKPAAGDGKN